MKIDITNKDPYQAVIDVIRELSKDEDGIEMVTNWIVSIKTDACGTDNELLLVDNGDYYWDNDWYEGGEVELLGFMDLYDVIVPPLEVDSVGSSLGKGENNDA